MTIAKMILLDKFKDNVKDLESYVLVEDLQEFVGTDLFEFQVETNDFKNIGTVSSIDINQEDDTLKVNDKVSFYDDFDFDFAVIDGVQTPSGIFVLEIDANAIAPFPEDPVEEDPVEEDEDPEDTDPEDTDPVEEDPEPEDTDPVEEDPEP